MASLLKRTLCATFAIASLVSATPVPAIFERQSGNDTVNLSACPGYKASNVQTSGTGLTASLSLAGIACNACGTDLTDLTLTVEYQTDQRLHVKIQDAGNQVYQVPSSVFGRPPSSDGGSASTSDLEFKHVDEPFSSSVVRRSNGDVLFDSSAASLVFETQYLRLRTSLPPSPSLYGLGETTDPFMLNTTNYTRTIWNRDAYLVPPGTNLYGDHPVYFDNRDANGTHGVFILNSDGQNIIIDDTNGQYLEYNIIGGVLDFYFLAGPSPVQVAQQDSEVVGKSAMMPYWGFGKKMMGATLVLCLTRSLMIDLTGFHQCRYGMQDVNEAAEVVANYSLANIPVGNDVDGYRLHVPQAGLHAGPGQVSAALDEAVGGLSPRVHRYGGPCGSIPALTYFKDYPPFNNGVDDHAFLTTANGSVYKGVVWPGITAFPDTGVNIDALWIDMNEASNFCVWPCADPEGQAISMGDPPRPPAIRLGPPRPIPGFPADFQPQCKAEVTFNVNASTFYGENIAVFGSAVTIGGGNNIMNAVTLSANNYPIWSATINMPANTTVTYQYVRAEPDGSYIYEAKNRSLATRGCGSTLSTHDTITTSSPPGSSKVKRIDSESLAEGMSLEKRQSSGNEIGLPGHDLINPPYTINNAAGSLSNKTLDTNLIHYSGYAVYDTHNLYGAMMSETSRLAMQSRRPGLRPMVITRSTFAGSGRQVGHWLGDNSADWFHYLISISELLEFGAFFQIPMVGSDVCGYAGVTNDLLCARWATLGAFSPFFRNHEASGEPPHEFYRWPLIAQAARNAIEFRYQLLDYIYTAFYDQNQTGTPTVQPMFFHYPEDKQTNSLGFQYFYGPGILVAPVTIESSTTTDVYLPDDVFYDYYTHNTVRGNASWVTLTDVPYTSIPLYYKGGSIVTLLANSANTTAELRKQNFDVVIAPGLNGSAAGKPYLDDGVSIQQAATSYITFTYDRSGTFAMTGSFGYDAGVSITSITVLGSGSGNASAAGAYDKVVQTRSTRTQTSIPLTRPHSVQLRGGGVRTLCSALR
ncbi:hypothetical protein LTR33_010476 [Friedmanniomyces endolithicus]|nr:hypothetical protein LTR33_010476 [Friedmanniomyces endolithicus]